jgi:hypothetical protein
MNLIRFFVTMLLFQVSPLFAVDSTKILEVSETGETLVLDVGDLEGPRIGDVAEFAVQTGEYDFPKITKVAQAEAVKVFPNYSIWAVKKIAKGESLTRGTRLLYYPIWKALRGRRERRIKQKKVILPKGKDIDVYLKELELGVPIKSVFKTNYRKGEQNNKTYPARHHDIETTQFDKWVEDDEFFKKIDGNIVKAKFTKNIDKTKDGDVIRKRHKKKTFDSQMDGQYEKYNRQKSGVLGLHQKKSDVHAKNGVKEESSSYINSYKKSKYEALNRRTIDPHAYRKIKLEGPDWSKDLNDEELRRFFVNSGINHELNRQRFALENKMGHEVTVSAATAFQTHTSSNDSSLQGTNYYLGVGYEYHLMRAKKDLARYSVEVFLDRGVEFYDLGDINGRFETGNYGIMGYYYLLGNPSELKKFLFPVGLGLKKGEAKVSSDSLSKSYQYSATALPIFKAGIKYRFSAGDESSETVNLGIGIHIFAQYESLTYSITETLQDSIKSKVQANDMKLVIGVNTYF